MSLDFLRDHEAKRARNYPQQPVMVADDDLTEGRHDTLDRDYEVAAPQWKPRTVQAAPEGWLYTPIRFIDGKDVGRTVAWVRGFGGYPLPVRLAEIGATIVRVVDGRLVRDASSVERVVAFDANQFAWHKVERFALGLRENGFRLLACRSIEKRWIYDFERQSKSTSNRTMAEMIRLERQAINHKLRVPTLVDGRLDPRVGAFDPRTTPIVGMIKTHSRDYLHAEGWDALSHLQPGQRTPAFGLDSKNIRLVTWYVRLAGKDNDMPNYGIVRLEIPRFFFEGPIKRNWQYLDFLSDIVCRYRHRDESYGRAAVSITPIVRAEELLGAQFTPTDTLCAQFYRLTDL